MKSKRYSDFDGHLDPSLIGDFRLGRSTIVWLDQDFKYAGETLPRNKWRILKMEDADGLWEALTGKEDVLTSTIAEMAMDHLSTTQARSGYDLLAIGYGNTPSPVDAPRPACIAIFAKSRETGMIYLDVIEIDTYYAFERSTQFDDDLMTAEMVRAIEDGLDICAYAREYAALEEL